MTDRLGYSLDIIRKLEMTSDEQEALSRYLDDIDQAFHNRDALKVYQDTKWLKEELAKYRDWKGHHSGDQS